MWCGVVYRHSLSPTSVAVIGDRVFWTDPHYRDVLYHRRSDKHSRDKISLNLTPPPTSIVAVDVSAQPRGQLRYDTIRDAILTCARSRRVGTFS